MVPKCENCCFCLANICNNIGYKCHNLTYSHSIKALLSILLYISGLILMILILSKTIIIPYIPWIGSIIIFVGFPIGLGGALTLKYCCGVDIIHSNYEPDMEESNTNTEESIYDIEIQPPPDVIDGKLASSGQTILGIVIEV